MLSLSLRVNGPLPEWLCRWDNRVKFVDCRGLEMGYDIFSITGAISIGSTFKWCWKTDEMELFITGDFPSSRKNVFQ